MIMVIEENHSPLISVVLPTYNVEDYLLQCLESVKAQTYQNIEVIIIIDGATDSSYEIAKEFCKTDNRFHVYWQENAGSGPARNNGLSHCSGDFVMFVDPDDWIEKDLLENLYQAQKDGDYDFVATRRTKVFCKDNKIVRVTPLHFKEEIIIGQNEVRKAYVRMLKSGAVGSPTQKLYKMSIIKENGVEFPALRRSQDVAFNYRYYDHIKSLRLISYSGYNYRIIVKKAPGKSGQDYYKTIEWFYKDYQRLYNSWNLPFPEQELCDFFFRVRIYANLQQFAAHGWDITPVIGNPTILHIVQTANPQTSYLRIVKYLINTKHYKLLEAFLKFVMFVKQRMNK